MQIVLVSVRSKIDVSVFVVVETVAPAPCQYWRGGVVLVTLFVVLVPVPVVVVCVVVVVAAVRMGCALYSWYSFPYCLSVCPLQ